MSIKEKAEEIKPRMRADGPFGFTGSESRITEGVFSLTEPIAPTSARFTVWHERALIVGILLAASIGSFVLGYFAGQGDNGAASISRIVPTPEQGRDAAAIVMSNETSAASSTRVEQDTLRSSSTTPSATTGAYVGSRKGTKYHLPWCPGANSISETNKVWFASKADAESKGYTPAANCKGL